MRLESHVYAGYSIPPNYDSLISKAVPEENRGLAYGLFWTSISLLALPAPYIGGLLWDNFTPRTPFWIHRQHVATWTRCGVSRGT